MRRVVIVEEKLVHYRVPLFERMHATLGAEGIDLVVRAQSQGVKGAFPWWRPMTNRTWKVGDGGAYLCWQPCWGALGGADLVVVGQENKFLLNYLLLAARPFTPRRRIAFWGHGRNFQSTDTEGLKERIKRAYSHHVDWWFAYNDLSRRLLEAQGYPPGRITSVHNTIDTRELASQFDAVGDAEAAALRATLGLGDGPVGIFCGSMYNFKMIPFILQAALRLRQVLPGFHMLFVGDGPDAGPVREAAARHDFIHFVGAKYGADRLPYFRVADGMLMPGAVGLGIIDAFVTGVPLFTTDNPSHGPEIVYLHDGVNGLMTRDDLATYVAAVGAALADPARLAALKAGSRESATRYSIEAMADAFCGGIRQVLALPR